jgi:hypothetical protein
MIDRFTVDEDSSDETRISALIRCCLHIEPDHLTDEDFWKEWGRVKYFMTLAYQVKWK